VTTQRVIAYHLARLQDKKPNVRLDAVQQLILLNVDETFAALQEAFSNDTDAAVRDATRSYLAARFIPQLSAPETAARLDAIAWLVKLEAGEALDALQTVYQNDADNDVRREAQKAGRAIFTAKSKSGAK
jgi:HEAT repeat protein